MDAKDWNARYRSADLVWSAGANELLVAEVEGLAPGSAVDVACGEGRNAIWLAEQGWRVTAFDFSSVAIDKARAIAAERGVEVDWRVSDVARWRPEQSFDLVAILYLQLPESARKAMLAKAAHTVAPGGTLLFIAHARRNLAEGFGGPQDPSVLADPEDVSADLSAELPDLAIECAEEVGRSVDTPGGHRLAIDLLVRARKGVG